MSWLRRLTPYADFSAQAGHIPVSGIPNPPPWILDVIEVTKDFPEGRRYYVYNPIGEDISSEVKLRIIFAPLDLPRNDALPQCISLFRQFGIPDEFTTERTVGACHSFAQRTSDLGTISWFHYLCKNIEVKTGAIGIRNRAAELGYQPPPMSPEADYSWNRSGFFLRSGMKTGLSLVCFGATLRVRQRLEEFMAAKAWDGVEEQPYILFDLVLEGLYFDIEGTLRNMTATFNFHEYEDLSALNGASKRKTGTHNPFAALHNCAKHVIHLSEAIESSILLTESIMRASGESNTTLLVARQLQESLRYRLSLFHSTQLKLSSLQKRIDNAINLSFNLVTQQDSLLMIQDSNTLRVIAFITMIFLPTTGVAAVAGSQLLVATREEGRWNVVVTPLFWLTWWVAIPLTVGVIGAAWLWHWWTHRVVIRR